MANLLGEQRSFYYYLALLLVSYASAVAIAVIRFHLAPLLVLLSAPVAWGLIKDFQARKLSDLTERTGQFGFLFGVLFTVGVWVS